MQLPKTDYEESFLQRQMDTTVKQIDRLVYELYGPVDEEIHFVKEVIR